MSFFNEKKPVSVNNQASSRNNNFWDHLFNDMPAWARDVPKGWDGQMLTTKPVFNIAEADDEYQFEAELPGVKRDDIHVEIKDNNLILKGEKKSFNEEKKKDYHVVERSHGSFYRAFALPGDIDPEKVTANLNDGILNISVGKRTESSPSSRKINIL